MKKLALYGLGILAAIMPSFVVSFNTAHATETGVVSASTVDADHNGHLDSISVTMSYNVVSVENATVDCGTTGARNVTAITVYAENPQELSVVFDEDTSWDTGKTCVVNFTNITDDTDTVHASDSVSAEDGAAPVIQDVRYFDDNYNGKIDRLVLDYSEPFAEDTAVSASDFYIANSGDFTGINVDTTGEVVTSPLIGWISLPIYESMYADTHDDSNSLLVGTENEYAVADEQGNVDNELRVQSQAEGEDVAKPLMKSVEYVDQDGDSKVDGLVIGFTETLSGAWSTLSENQLSIAENGGFVGIAFGTDTTDLLTDNTDTVLIPVTEAENVATTAHAQLLLAMGADEAQFQLYDLYSNSSDAWIHANPENSQFSRMEVLDGVAPLLLSSSPAANGNMSDLNGNVTLTFSEDIAPDSVRGTAGLVEMGADVTADGATVTIDPVSALTANSTYTVYINDAPKDTEGDFEATAIVRLIILRGPELTDPSGNSAASQTFTFTTNQSTSGGGNGGHSGGGGSGAPGANPVVVTTPAPEVLGTTDTGADANGVKPGDYIRAQSWDTVYYVSSDMVRHPIFDHQTYFTHEDSWDKVIVLPDDKMKDYPMGDLYLPKVGVVLVKIVSTNDVYALEAGQNGATVLRRIPDEATARALFGEHWADYVIDLDVTVFRHFVKGTDLDLTFPVDMSKMKTRVALNNN